MAVGNGIYALDHFTKSNSSGTFIRLQHGERKQFLCKCTFLEIYQEQVYDLLDPAAANLQIRENMKTGVFVDGLMEQVVATPAEAYQVFFGVCLGGGGLWGGKTFTVYI